MDFKFVSAKLLIFIGLFPLNGFGQTLSFAKENVFKSFGRHCLYAIKKEDTLFFESAVIDKSSNTFFIDTLIINKAGIYSSNKLIVYPIGMEINVYPNKDSTLYFKYFCTKMELRKSKAKHCKTFKSITDKQFELYQHLENGRLNNLIKYTW